MMEICANWGRDPQGCHLLENLAFARRVCWPKSKGRRFRIADRSIFYPSKANALMFRDLFPPLVEGNVYSMNDICEATGKRWRAGGRAKSAAALFLTDLILRLNNTASPLDE